MIVPTCPHGRHRASPCARCHTSGMIDRAWGNRVLARYLVAVGVTAVIVVVFAGVGHVLGAPARRCEATGGTWDGRVGVCANNAPLGGP